MISSKTKFLANHLLQEPIGLLRRLVLNGLMLGLGGSKGKVLDLGVRKMDAASSAKAVFVQRKEQCVGRGDVSHSPIHSPYAKNAIPQEDCGYVGDVLREKARSYQ
jgi:hypothetical protein